MTLYHAILPLLHWWPFTTLMNPFVIINYACNNSFLTNFQPLSFDQPGFDVLWKKCHHIPTMPLNSGSKVSQASKVSCTDSQMMTRLGVDLEVWQKWRLSFMPQQQQVLRKTATFSQCQHSQLFTYYNSAIVTLSQGCQVTSIQTSEMVCPIFIMHT